MGEILVSEISYSLKVNKNMFLIYGYVPLFLTAKLLILSYVYRR